VHSKASGLANFRISRISASRFERRGGEAAQDNYRHFRRLFRRAAEDVNMGLFLLSEGREG
jgi:hypothetical protein